MTFFQQLFDSAIFSWVILPILIFLSRICDVSIGTLRIIFISKGKKLLAPLLGFVEISIWLLAFSQIMQNLNNIVCFIAYAAGFSMGNFVGVLIEEKLALGTLIVRVFLTDCKSQMKEKLSAAGFGVTSIDAKGKNGDVKILYCVIKRKALDQAVSIIETCQFNVFYSVEEVKAVKKGIFPSSMKPKNDPIPGTKHYRKSGK